MFDIVADNRDPIMLAIFPYRVLRWREVLVGKAAHGNGEQVAKRPGMIPERRSAYRAEMETGRIAAVADMLIDLVLAADGHRVARKARLKSKSRAAAFLAVIAMADRHADRFAGAGNGKLSAAAGGDPRLHDLCTPPPSP